MLLRPRAHVFPLASLASGKQIIVDEKVVWHFPDVANMTYPEPWAREAIYRRSYTLSDGVLQADPAPPRVPPAAPTVSPR